LHNVHQPSSNGPIQCRTFHVGYTNANNKLAKYFLHNSLMYMHMSLAISHPHRCEYCCCAHNLANSSPDRQSILNVISPYLCPPAILRLNFSSTMQDSLLGNCAHLNLGYPWDQSFDGALWHVSSSP